MQLIFNIHRLAAYNAPQAEMVLAMVGRTGLVEGKWNEALLMTGADPFSRQVDTSQSVKCLVYSYSAMKTRKTHT